MIDLYVFINSISQVNTNNFLQFINIYFHTQFRNHTFNVILQEYTQYSDIDVIRHGLTKFYNMNKTKGWLLYFGNGNTINHKNVDVFLFTNNPQFRKCNYSVNKITIPLNIEIIEKECLKIIRKNLDYLFKNNFVLYYDRMKINEIKIK